jgi:M6 family metalloprotease-like protein
MKRFILLITACFCLVSAHAAYLKDVPKTLTQPDGAVLHCYASGDEFFNYLHDADGFTIMQHPQTGFYVYADKRDGQLVATEFVAGRVDPASKNLKPFNLISPQEWMARRKAWQDKETLINRDAPNHGTLNNISIFIRFSDDGEFTNSYSSIDKMFNDVSENAISMRSYFRAASYGAIEIPTYFYPGHNGETIISYKDSHPRSYYQPYNASNNPNGYQNEDDRREREFSLLERTVNYINANYPVPTSLNLDYDNDGLVDNVCFIVRGDVGEWSSLLWPHKWSLYDRTVRINGKRVYTFNFQLADAAGYFNTSTMCHEMNHSLSAPDLYHYYYGTDISPAGIWDLMESTTMPPQHCGAYMKMKYGHWIDDIPEITQAGTYTLNPISSATPTNVAYKIQSDDPNQYYVLEYRDNTSLFETGLPGSGLLVYRIDTRFDGNASYDPANGVYDEVYIFRPGGSSSMNGNLNNAYFSSNVGRDEFSASSDAYPFFTDGTIDNNFRIYNITNAGNTISFTYGVSAVCDPPMNLVASVDGKDVSLSWDAAINAQSYNIYRNGTFIGNTSSLTYLDCNLPYATYTYFLKSVDASGLFSASSETVTVDVTYLQVVAEHYPNANNVNSPYVKVHWYNDRSLYNVYRSSCDGGDEELIAENVTGNQYIDYAWAGLTPGSYKYGVSVVNGRGKSGEIHWNDSHVALNHHTLDVSVSPVPVSGNFGEPSRVTDDDGWLYYDNGTYATSLGTGGSTFYWGIMYPSDMLSSYTGSSLSKVALYENSFNTESINLDIYLGSIPSSSTLVYSDVFIPMGGNAFHEITLSQAVAIDGTQNLWIVFSEYGTYPASASTDSGDANGRWISFDGSNWMDLASVGGSGYCWMIRGYVEEIIETMWSNCIEKTSVSQQTIALQTGWNWISTYIEVEDPIEMLQAVEAGLGENGIQIKNSQVNTEYDSEWGWFGDLDDIGMTNEQMYAINVNAPCTLTVEGTPANPEDHPITINQGWNWIGFPSGVAISLEDAFAGFAIEGDKIKNRVTQIEYDPEWGWFGDFETLEPGQGYMYYSASSTQRTLIFPSGAK